MHEAQQRRETGFTLDFSETAFAAPVAMAQLVVETEALREHGMHFDVIAPKEPGVRAVFEHSNWAHHLNPVNYEPSVRAPDLWLPVRRYQDENELFSLVNHTLEVVLRTTKIRREALHGLEWALNEMADNVLVHAEAPAGGLVAVTRAPKRRRVQFAVADAGKGIPETMRSAYPRLTSDLGAVRESLKQGVTRNRAIGAGNGLAGALRIATAVGGSFLVHSGRALIQFSSGRGRPFTKNYTAAERLDGTVVFFEIAVDRKFDLEATLLQDGIGVVDWDFLDSAYSVDEGDVRLLIRDEVGSTGTRLAGMPVRIKARNLVEANSASRVILDFSGVERVSSSFADEVVGKLLLELGSDRFRERVWVDGLDARLVGSLVRRVLSQRQAESTAARGPQPTNTPKVRTRGSGRPLARRKRPPSGDRSSPGHSA
jgi:anti-sigma regulatory factor (Ser/Thr protein kinase)